MNGSGSSKKSEAPLRTAEIDRGAAAPLYHQIQMRLTDDIVSGRLPNGSAAPTEHELAKLFGVSRITARRALDELAQAKLVTRRRRLGTQVDYEGLAPPLQADVHQAVDSLIAFGRASRVQLLELGPAVAEEGVSAALRCPLGATVTRAVRLRWLEQTPLGYVISFMPPDVGEGFGVADLEASPVLSLIQASGVRIGGGNQVIEAVAASRTIAAALAVEPRSPLLLIRRTLEDAHHRPVLLTLAYYRPDRYQLRLELGGGD